MAKHYHCPVNGWDCPYYKDEENHPCQCTMEDPMAECDDFQAEWEGATEDEYTDDHEVKDIRCPSCGGQLIEEERESTEYDEYSVDLEKCGKCEKCGKRYYYYEEYVFSRVHGFTEAY